MDDSDRRFLQREQLHVEIARRRLTVTYYNTFATGWLFDQRHQGGTIASRCPNLSWPEDRGRRPAMNYVKDGQVMFGPAVPDGEGELVVQVVRRRGKKLRVKILRDGRPGDRSQVGCIEDWHADNNMPFFGMPTRGEKRKVIEPLLESVA